MGEHRHYVSGAAIHILTQGLLLRLFYALSILPERRERLKAIGRGLRAGLGPQATKAPDIAQIP